MYTFVLSSMQGDSGGPLMCQVPGQDNWKLFGITSWGNNNNYYTLLAIADISTVQSSARTFIHNVILFIDTSNNASYSQFQWLFVTPYLSTIASNDNNNLFSQSYKSLFCRLSYIYNKCT